MNLDSSRRRGPKPVRQSLRFQQRQAARDGILAAAEELFASKGLSASVAEIAKLAGVAVGTLYNYFADRDDLVKALFETRRATMRPQLRAAIAATADLAFEPRLRRFVHDTLEIYDTHRRFLKVAIETEYMKSSTSSTSADMHAAIDAIVAAGVCEKQIAAGATAELVSMMIAGAIKMVVLRRVADGRPFVDAGDELVSIILDGARGLRR